MLKDDCCLDQLFAIHVRTLRDDREYLGSSFRIFNGLRASIVRVTNLVEAPCRLVCTIQFRQFSTLAGKRMHRKHPNKS